MKKLLGLFLCLLLINVSYSAPLPRTKDKKKEDPAKFLLGQWDMQWSVTQGTVTFHENNIITGHWPNLHSRYWQGTYEYKDGILSVRETFFDEQGNLVKNFSCDWKVKLIKKENAYTGNLETNSNLYEGAKVTITRSGNKT